MFDESLIIKAPTKLEGRTTITRSFSYKLNTELIGGPRFESRDFFCCQSSECAIEDAAEVSSALHAFCKSQVLQAVREYRNELQQGNRLMPPAGTQAAADYVAEQKLATMRRGR